MGTRAFLVRFYFRKSSAEFRLSQSHFHLFGNLWYRRLKRKDYWNLAYALWFWMFLEFASKIGVISVFPFQDTGSMYASYYSQGITVPYGVNTRGLPGQRHLVYVSLDKNGMIKVNGSICRDNILILVLSNQLLVDPQIVAFLIIDRDCEMPSVNKLFMKLRSAGLLRISLMCENNHYKILN